MRVSRRSILIPLAVLVVAAVAFDRRRQVFRYANVRAILAENLDGRLIPHRVNRLEILDSVLERGIRSMEIDVLFRTGGACAGHFEVGHDDGDAQGIVLDAFFERMAPFQLQKIWLDVKNLDRANLPDALRELERLDADHSIRRIAIVECYAAMPELATLSAAGFHVSYYLREKGIADLVATGDAVALAEQAQRIAKQVEECAVAAVSFRETLNPFVKAHLEPLIPTSIRYHAWDSIELRRWGAIDQLQASSYFADPRLDTIIYRL